MNGKVPTLLSVLFTFDVKQETDDRHIRPLAQSVAMHLILGSAQHRM